jgi:hypothetical protein
MFGRKGLFGKKQATAREPARNPPGPDNSIFDPSLWEGERGDFLRQAGFAPDDPKNRLGLQEPVSEQLARDDAALWKALTALNDATRYPIGAFTLLREEVWQGRLGGFLLKRLDLSPFRPWNVLFLPMDAAGAAALNLPIGTYDDDDIAESEVAIEMIAELFSGKPSPEANALAIVCDAVADNVPYLFPREILDYSPNVRDARRRVRSFAFQRAIINRFDKDVIIRSQQTFLGKPEEQLVA